MIIPARVYYQTFGLLLALTGVTVGVSYIDLGSVNPIVALTIAAVKAVLVGLYFMHLRYGKQVIVLAAVASFYWLGIMLALTMGDYLTRGWLGVQGY